MYFRRLIGSFSLDPMTYEDVEADGRATLHAGLTVLLASVAAGIGAQGFGAQLWALVPFTIISLVGWGVWALLTFAIGTRFLPGARTHSDPGELLRTMGFAAAPGLLLVLGALPGLAVPIFAMVTLWMLVAMILAVRQALDYESIAHAAAVCVFGWGLSVALVIAVGSFIATPVE